MSYPYYEYSVPFFIKGLKAVDHLLSKAEEYIKEKGIPENEILEAKLAPDMFPLVRQVRIVTDNAKGAASRLAGVAVPVFEDTETTLADLHARIAKTITFLETLLPEQFAEAASRRVELPYFPNMHFLGDGYLKEYAIPNFYFHYVTVYDILRMKGVILGKADYMNGLPLQKN